MSTLFSWIIKILMWILTGFVAANIMKSRSNWFINLIVGFVGGALGGLLFSLFYNGPLALVNWLLSFIGGVIGACIIILLAKILKILK